MRVTVAIVRSNLSPFWKYPVRQPVKSDKFSGLNKLCWADSDK
jgi:hypothetical protein